MQYLAVILAAAASYAFGALWYMMLAKPWMADVGMTEADVNSGTKTPYVVAAVAALIVAGTMRHVFAMSGLDTLSDGIMGGAGLGFLIAAPWIATNYSFSGRPRRLFLIDGGYAAIGCTIMGIVLSFFL
jgi:hypothetical protein